MKLWHLTQDDHAGWCYFDACIVAAETEEEAKLIHPGEGWFKYPTIDWADAPEQVHAVCIGEAFEGMPAGVILASFNEG